jgi:hypothetical protein
VHGGVPCEQIATESRGASLTTITEASHPSQFSSFFVSQTGHKRVGEIPPRCFWCCSLVCSSSSCCRPTLPISSIPQVRGGVRSALPCLRPPDESYSPGSELSERRGDTSTGRVELSHCSSFPIGGFLVRCRVPQLQCSLLTQSLVFSACRIDPFLRAGHCMGRFWCVMGPFVRGLRMPVPEPPPDAPTSAPA